MAVLLYDNPVSEWMFFEQYKHESAIAVVPV
jgi:hypothetical protein